MRKTILFCLVLSLLILTGCELPSWLMAEPTEQFCTKNGTDYSMGFSEAKELAKKSECGDRFKENGIPGCNPATGTWWIDLNIEKEGCSPACVINVKTKKAEINWRCTGLIQ